jgi:hypothetical protein
MLHAALALFVLGVVTGFTWAITPSGASPGTFTTFIRIPAQILAPAFLFSAVLCFICGLIIRPRRAVSQTGPLSFWQKFRFTLAEKIAQKIIGRDFVLRITPAGQEPFAALNRTLVEVWGGAAGGSGLVTGGTSGSGGVIGATGISGPTGRQGSVLVEYLLLCGASMTATLVAMQALAQVQAEWLEQLRQMVQGMAP